LPTEAECEYAARGGTTAPRYGDLDQIAWYGENTGDAAHEVAQKRPNSFGLFDTLGNMFEWVHDWYEKNYYWNSPSQDPTGPGSTEFHAVRGESWLSIFPSDLRVSRRGWGDPRRRDDSLGFRCVGNLGNP